jgi:hypothetical protein
MKIVSKFCDSLFRCIIIGIIIFLIIIGYWIPLEIDFFENLYEKFYPKPKPPPQHWFYVYVNNFWNNLTDYFPALKNF